MRKVRDQMTCCFCGKATDASQVGDYVELEVTFPDFDTPMEQYFGAHVDCFHAAVTEEHRIFDPFA
jgi:hypothetical protein